MSQQDARLQDDTSRLQAAEARELAAELAAALDDPKRGEWGGYPWEHLGDAERDVRVLLRGLDALSVRLREAEAREAKAEQDVSLLRHERDGLAAALERERLALRLDEQLIAADARREANDG